MIRRTGTGRSRYKINAAAIAAWKAGDRMLLNLALRLEPWKANPLDVREDYTPEAGDLTEWAVTYPEMIELRRQLIALAGEPPTPAE